MLRAVNPLLLPVGRFDLKEAKDQYPQTGLSQQTTATILSLAAILALSGSALFLAPVRVRRRDKAFHLIKVNNQR